MVHGDFDRELQKRVSPCSDGEVEADFGERTTVFSVMRVLTPVVSKPALVNMIAVVLLVSLVLYLCPVYLARPSPRKRTRCPAPVISPFSLRFVAVLMRSTNRLIPISDGQQSSDDGSTHGRWKLTCMNGTRLWAIWPSGSQARRNSVKQVEYVGS